MAAVTKSSPTVTATCAPGHGLRAVAIKDKHDEGRHNTEVRNPPVLLAPSGTWRRIFATQTGMIGGCRRSALANRSGDGTLPSGRDIGRQHGRHER